MPINAQQSAAYRPAAPERAHGAPPLGPAASDTKELTLLLVEDDLLSRNMLLVRLKALFKGVIAAASGEEAFQLFCAHKPDIVLTDQVMSGCSGLDLMLKIRGTGAKTPVILMTSIDEKVLLEAINNGVERFIPKPFDFGLLIRTLEGIAGEIADKRLLERHREQEVDLLRYRDAYNSMQQESSLSKERHIVHHDRRDQALQGAAGARWLVDATYCPRDILCGDGYSVRHLFDGRLLIFVVDAMGSGMSASLTAMLTTSFCNYQVEYLHLWENFSLRIFLKRFQEYLHCMLLEEEVLSCGFLLVDLVQESIETALFALPPLLIRGVDGSVRALRGENPPLGVYPGEVRTSTFSLSDTADILIMTDGVTDAPVAGGGSYREKIMGDFAAAPTLAALLQRFAEKTGGEDLDDLTLLHLRRLDFGSAWSWRGEPELTLEGLSRTIREFLAALTGEADAGTAALDEVETILTEALTNALEHGCLGIDRQEKARLLLEGDYDEALVSMPPLPGAGITLSATLWRGADTPLLLLEVQDRGPGLPENALRTSAETTAVNGRGLQMIGRLCDSLSTDGPGGRLIILKTLEGY